MPPRIIRDLTQDTCPDFSAPTFTASCDAIARVQGITGEEAAQGLVVAWTAVNITDCKAWKQQHQGNVRAEEEMRRVMQEADNIARAQQEQEAEAEKREEEKKKPKINGFNVNKTIDDVVILRLSVFTLSKLESLEYVELWYFSQEGLQDSVDGHLAVAEEAYGLTKVNGFMTLKLVN